MDLDTIDRWNTASLDAMAETLGARVSTVAEIESAVSTAGQLPGWFGGGADSARSLYTVTANDLRDEAAVLGAAQRLATETSEAVKHVQRQLAGVRSDAAAASMKANVSRLQPELTRLQARRDQLIKQIDDHIFGGAFTNEDAELAQVEKKIADVQKLQQVIGADPWDPVTKPNGRMLLVMDMESGEQGKAAIALGNPATADHVSVTAPGVDTTIHGSFDSMLGESEALRTETLRQLGIAGRHDETVATISWLDFEPPVSDGSRPPGWYLTEAAQQDRASAGADDLVDFYRGLEATSTKDDPHIVALGHSYGSLTQGLALQEPGGHPVR